MSTRLTCFVIAPIGESGSDVRKDSDDLLDLIIKPALEIFNIDVLRGDHRNESGQIDVDVVKLVQESDLCVVDISIENVNVFYELGRRDETGKPVILLKSAKSQALPVDIAARRYIEFDLDDRRSLISARCKLKDAVQHFVDSGMEKTKGTSLYAISEKIDRIERILSRLSQPNHGGIEIPTGQPEEFGDTDPATLFRYAISENNIPMAEYAMSKLYYSMDEISYYDIVVEQVAALGSRKAGQMMIEYMDTFIDSVGDLQKQIEYIICLITYLGRTNQEADYIDIVEPIALKLKDENNQVPAQVYNQLNRIYYGAYVLSNDISHLDKAIYYLGKAIEQVPDDSNFNYNYALCYKARFSAVSDEHDKHDSISLACDYVRKAIELDGESYDPDHLALACRLFHQVNDSRWLDYLEILKKVAPFKERLLRKELK